MHFAKIASMAKKGLKALQNAKQVKGAAQSGSNLFGGKKASIIAIAIPVGGMFMLIILAVIIAYAVIAPISNIYNKIRNTAQSAWNFITTFCWGTDKECEYKAEKKFDDKLKEVYDDMLAKYHVEIDISLIKVTLLYNTYDFDKRFEEIGKDADTDELPDPADVTTGVNYNKLRKKIEPLAENQISKKVDRFCATSGVSIDDPNYQKIYHSTVSGLGIKENVPSHTCESGYTQVYGAPVYYVDYERYEKYLRDGFLEKNILTDKSDVPMSTRVDVAVKEIFSIAETAKEILFGVDAKYMVNGGFYDQSCNFNLTQVELVAHNGTVIKTVSMEDYIVGVTYAETGYNPDNPEYMKTQMIVAKTYALARGKYDASSKKIQIRASTADQAWCDINADCMVYYSDIGDFSYSWFLPSYKEIEAVSLNHYKGPLTTSQIEKIRSIYREVSGYLYVPKALTGPLKSYTQLTEIGYVSSVQLQWRAWANEGKSFKEILDLTAGIRSEYSNHYLYSLSDHCSYTAVTGSCTTSTPLLLSNGETFVINSPFGERPHPIYNTKSMHNGVDLKASMGTPIYNIYDGTVITQTSISSDCGVGVTIGHDINGDGKYDYKSTYCHMIDGSLTVKSGDFVTGGTKIGLVGNTGASNGPHLHFGIYDYSVDKYVDPTSFLYALANKTSVFDNAKCAVGDITKLPQLYQTNYSNVVLCTTNGGEKRTISSSGCLISSFAAAYYMLTGNFPNMSELAQDIINAGGYVCNQGGVASNVVSNSSIIEKYNIKGTSMGTTPTYDDVVNKLKSGKKIIVSVGNGTSNVERGGFNASDGTHYVMLDHIGPTGKIYVFNPNRGTNEGYKSREEIQEHILDRIYSGMWYLEKVG